MLASLINNYRPKGKKAASSAAKPTTPFSRRTADPASSQPYGPQVYDIGGAKSSFEDGDAASSTRSFEPTASHVSAAPTESVVSPRVDIDIDFTPADWFPSHFLKTDSVVGPGVLGGRSIADVLAAPPPGTSSSSSSRAAAAAVADSFDVGNDDGLETEDEDDDDDDVLDADVLNPQQMPGLSNRKGAPAPIKIPNVAIHAPKVQIDRSASTVSRPESMFSLEGASAISGTTLARALIGDAFVLSHDRSSRYRSGASVLTRSDSATLPRGDFLFSPGRRSGPLSGTFTPLDADGVVPPMPDLPAEVKRAIAESRDRLRVDDESERSPGAGFRSGAEARTPDTAVSETPISRITESSSPVSLDPPASENAESEPTTPSRPPLVHVGLSPSAFPISPGQESTAATSEARSSRDIGDVLDYYNFDSSPGGGSDRSGFDPPSPDSGPLEGQQLLGPARFQPAFSPITEEDSLSQSQLSPDSIRSRMTGAKSLAPSPSSSPASARWPGDVRILPRTPSGNMTMIPSPLTIPPTNSLRPSSAAIDEDDEELDGDDGDDGDDNELLPPPRGIFARQRAGGAPSPIQVVRDSRDPNAYNITVTQRAEPSSAGSTPATEYDFSRQQSFPETPSAFSPLFSSGIDSEQRHSMMPPSTGTASANGLPSLAQQVLLSRASTSVRGGRQSRARNRSTAIWPSASVSAAVKDMLPVSPDQGPLCDEEKQQMVVVEEEVEAEPEPEPEPKAETVEELRTPSEPPDSASVYSASVQSFRSRAAQRLSQASMQAEPVEDPKRQKPLPAMPNSPVESELEMDMPGATSSTSLRAASIAASVSASASPHTEPLPLSRRSSTKSSDEAAPALGSPPPYSVNDGHSTPDSDQFVTPRLSVQSVVATPGPSRRSRARPPLPVGPRRPSTSGPAAAALQGPRNRNGSVSSVASTPGGRRVTSTAPRFQTPPIKWRGYTMEAAKWTFSSSQLQDIVSRAIRQSSEASSIRLLNLDTVDVEIPEELHRLEMQRTDVKTRYKMLTRKRAGLLASLDASIEVDEILRVVESVKEISAELDRLAEDLHSADEQITQLTSLRDVHSSSALAMALRKLNASFLKQITASEALRAQIEMLQAERDEAWTQAVDVAHELDDLSERMSPGGYTNNNNRRSSRVLASKKSSIRMSKTGLRSRRSSVSSSVGPALDDMDIPPVPPIPRPHEIRTSGLSAVSSANSETRALDQAQQELYSMLGITDIPTRRQSYVEQSPGGALSSAPSRPSSLPGTVYNNTDDRNAMLATLGLLSD